MNEQEIYISMDDSGVLHYNERCSVYGGIVFLKKSEQEDFERKYKSIINKIKCKYCHSNKEECLHICPEIKSANVKDKDKRRLWNLIKKEICFAVIINNKKVNENIMNNKASRGRYRDFTQRVIIKKVMDKLIKSHLINPYIPIKLIIRIDQQATITNANEFFLNDIYKELTKGIKNFAYNTIYNPIIFSNLEIDLKYVLSHRHISIQAADFIAGEARRTIISNIDASSKLNKLKYLDVKLFLP